MSGLATQQNLARLKIRLDFKMRQVRYESQFLLITNLDQVTGWTPAA